MSTTVIGKRILAFGCLLLLGTLFSGPVQAADAIGSVTSAIGKVSVLRGGQLPAAALQSGDPVYVGDFVRTKSDSTAEVRFNDGNLIKIAPRSRVDISEYATERDTRTLKLSRGKVEAVVTPPVESDDRLRQKRFEIHTPNAVAGVRGTTFLVFYDSNTSGILVREVHPGDSVYAFNPLNPDQIVIIPAGSLTLIRDLGLPTPPRPAGDGEMRAFGHLLQELWDGGSLLTAFGEGDQLWLLPINLSELYPQVLGVEVGVVDMISSPTLVQSAYDLTVSMTANFFAPGADAVPIYWGAGNVQGDWTFVSTGPAFDPTGTPVFLSGFGPNGQASLDFTVNSWTPGTGAWTADIALGSGTTAVGTPFVFSGTAAGNDAVTSFGSGTFTGTATGNAGPDPFLITGGN
jgi:hypothetical protein